LDGERGVKTDEALLRAVGRGDRAAFRELYERHAERVFRFALSLVRAPHLAEEVLQETMVAVWKNADKFRGASKATTWILGITKNQGYGLLRREKRGERTPEDPVAEPDPAATAELCVRVEDAVATLPPHLREVLHLVFYEEMTLGEAAAVLGIPEGTVKSRMFHARKALAKVLT
jgi:RNA polymerase sigma-70 factor (ECF subfamily)